MDTASPRIIEGEVNTRYYQLMAQWTALNLEAKGAKLGIKMMRGPSLKSRLAVKYGLSVRANIDTVRAAHIAHTQAYAVIHNLELPEWAIAGV